MWHYFLTLLIYVITFDAAYLLTNNLMISLFVKLLVLSLAFYLYRNHFKLKMRFDFLSVFLGLIIFALWVLLDNFYPHPPTVEYTYNLLDIISKMLIGVIFAPVIEEFFTRFFLMRWVISKDWRKVQLGKYTFMSFIVTVLFFGFSHNRWLVGIITGILLNLLIYKKKNIESCVLAHAVANLALGIYVIVTGSWQFW